MAVAEAAGDAAVEFDEAVGGFGAAVVRAAGIEVAEELDAPLLQGPSQAGDLGDWARGEGLEDLLGDGPTVRVAVLVVGGADYAGGTTAESLGQQDCNGIGEQQRDDREE